MKLGERAAVNPVEWEKVAVAPSVVECSVQSLEEMLAASSDLAVAEKG